MGSPLPTQFGLSDIAKRLGQIIMFGHVFAVDYAASRVRVRIGQEGEENILESEWLPWMNSRQANTRAWIAPEVGEWVVIACPYGNLNHGVILGSKAKDLYPSEALSPDITRTTFFSPGTEQPLILEDQHRERAIRRRWLASSGTFRHDIGGPYNGSSDPLSSHVQTADMHMLSVGNTYLAIKNGEIVLSVDGGATEMRLTTESIVGHVQKKSIFRIMADKIDSAVEGLGVFTILKDKIEMLVNAKGRQTLTEDQLEGSIEDNGIFRLKKETIGLFLVEQQARFTMSAMAVISGLVRSAVEIYTAIVASRVTGSSHTITPGAIVNATPLLIIPTLVETAGGGDPGATPIPPDPAQEALGFSEPDIPALDTLPPAPIVQKGNAPYTPE